MAVLPSRPGSACFGRERLAVDRSRATGELAALPADPEAAGTTRPDDTPVPAVLSAAVRSGMGASALSGRDERWRYLARRGYHYLCRRLGTEVTPELWGVMGASRGSGSRGSPALTPALVP